MSPVCANGRLVTRPPRDFKRDSRATPPELYELLDAEFNFTLDPCPLDDSATAGASLWNKDGLRHSWAGHIVFCNPPYSDIEPWLAKAREAHSAVYLLPVKSDMGWWHDRVMLADEVRFIRRRLRFVGMKQGGAPFASVVVIFDARRGLHPPVWKSMLRPERGG